MRRRLAVLSVILMPMGLVSSPSAQAAESSLPVVGECHNLTYAQAVNVSDPSAPVDCATSHTTMTIQVTTLPASVWDKGAHSRTSYAIRACDDAQEAYFGLSPKVLERTVFARATFFFPTDAEVAAGERFVRCDVGKHDSSRVYPLAADPHFTKVTKQVALCMTAHFAFAACTTPHRYYPTAAVTLPLPRPKPGREIGVVSRRCLVATGRRAASVSWPAGKWNKDSLGVCYRRD